jgi:tRNA-Thr(GGU) m(6)t(6)A37 methyltransferase TsaA
VSRSKLTGENNKNLYFWIAKEKTYMTNQFKVVPIGFVRKRDAKVWIEIKEAYWEALLGLDGFSHIHVLYWLHENDSPEKRKTLRVHPRKDERNPLTGVFATHSPLRPNPIALTLCKILELKEPSITIDDIDALDGSPVIDIKCYIPSSRTFEDLQLPAWV